MADVTDNRSFANVDDMQQHNITGNFSNKIKRMSKFSVTNVIVGLQETKTGNNHSSHYYDSG
jgi:hypothetical protein